MADQIQASARSVQFWCALLSFAAIVHLSGAAHRLPSLPVQDASQEKVEVDFYEESLCPFCAKFTTDTLAPLVKSDLSQSFNLRLIPYGNAKDTPEGLQCQHGEAECRVNRVFSCAIYQGKQRNVWFPFIECVEAHYGADIESSIENCAQEAELDYEEIKECASGTQGDELQRAAANETDALEPKHQYVPWVVVNGVPLMDDYANLRTYICVALAQNARPDACFSSATVIRQQLRQDNRGSWQGPLKSIMSLIMGWF